MDNKKRSPLRTVYDITVIILALTSIILAILDICGKADTTTGALFILDTSILIFFAVDYIIRFILAKGKWMFFRNNIFDLLAIIPFSSIFTVFRFSRLLRLSKAVKIVKLTKLAKLTRAAAFFGKLKKELNGFLHTNGFVYMLSTGAVLIITASALMSFFENRTLPDALWWSIVTCSTVGYGDIAPTSVPGRIVAVILMIFGIGFISMLTGTVTSFFAKRAKKPADAVSADELNRIIAAMSEEERAALLSVAQAIRRQP